jgi:hypothetical protein
MGAERTGNLFDGGLTGMGLTTRGERSHSGALGKLGTASRT